MSAMPPLTSSPYADFMQQGQVTVGDHVLHFEIGGPADGEVILLIMGLGAQLLWWPNSLLTALIEAGYRVIRFDNRDIGLSGKFRGKTNRSTAPAMLARHVIGLGRRNPAPYNLFDMADDVIGLMDQLGLQRAHLVGGSMGGMIAQIVAAQYPQRVGGLGLIFTSNLQPLLPPPGLAQLRALTVRPGSRDPDVLIRHGAQVLKIIGSPKHYEPEQALQLARQSFERCYHPAGYLRHFMAVLSTGSLKTLDRQIKAPTVVIHGDRDRLLPLAHGAAVARAIRQARLVVIPDMGHDLLPAFMPQVADALLQTLRQASASALPAPN